MNRFDGIRRQYDVLGPKLEEAALATARSCQFIGGSTIKELENRLAELVRTNYAIACASGTDALILALRAIGVEQGDSVITTPMTFAATVEAICLVGAKPVFVDIDPAYYTLDPQEVRGKLDATTKAIIAVDLFGQPCNYAGLQEVTKGQNIAIVEDAAQSLGAGYNGAMAGDLGLVGCTSFYPTKPLSCWGDGGMCFTRREDIAKRILLQARHGEAARQEHLVIGTNSRLDAIQAAVLLEKLKVFPEEIQQRQRVASWYNELLEGCNLVLPQTPNGTKSAWSLYSVLAQDSAERERLRTRLLEGGVPTDVFYWKPLHLQRAYRFLGYKKGDFPISEEMAKRVFTLPLHPYLSYEDCKKVTELIYSRRIH